MFRSTLIVGLLMLLQSALAQNPIPAEPVLVEVERSRDWRLEQFISTELDENGTLVSVTNSWTSLASGMHYFDGKEWIRTIAAFEETPEMFIAQYGPHKVILNKLLRTPDAVDLLTDDGTRLRSAPAMLAYRNRVTGETVLLGEVRADARGELIEPNMVLWREAFDSVPGANVRAVYTAGGFEMDVVLSAPLPDPVQLGLTDAEQVDLEVLTAFQDGPAPVKFPYTIVDGLLDERLDFGSMTMSGGLAFSIDQADKLHAATAPVRKTFQRIEGGDWLIESVPYPSVRTLLESLPANKEGAQIDRDKGGLPGKTKARSVAASRKAIVVQASLAHAPAKNQTESWTQRLARGAAAVKAQGGERRSASIKGPQGLSTLALQTPLAKLRNTEGGVVIDYTIVNAAANYTFKSDTTYLVQGAVNLTGTTIFEGGTVIKYAWSNYTSLRLLVGTSLDWRASPYLPVIFTAQDDNSVGEIIAGNTYTPTATDYYITAALHMENATILLTNRLHNFRIAHAKTGLQFQLQNGVEIWNAQFVNSQTGIQSFTGGPLRNVLFHHVLYPVWHSGGSEVKGEHLTIDIAHTFPWAVSANLTNSLLVNVTNIYPNSTGIANHIRSGYTTTFSTNGAGHHYLADPALRGTGSTGINADLAAELKLMTTAAPVNLTNHFTTATILSPVVPRNTGVPDIGYHYWPIDWTWSGLNVANATLVLTNGVVVANYGTNGTTLTTGGKVVSLGGPKAMNRIISYQLVQERPFVWGPTGSHNSIFSSPSASATEIDLRFTDVLLPANTVSKRALNWNLSWAGPVRLMDSRLRNISQTLYGTNGTQTALLALTNNIFERCNFTIGHGYGIYAYALELYAWNNLFLGGDLTLTYLWTWYPWAIRDNVFANLTPYVLGTPPAGNNGYTATYAPLGGVGNKTNLLLNWQAGLLGPYYYPTTGGGLSTLVDTGSRLTASASLYHHTTRVDQTKDAGIAVDIGFHYVALNNSNVPFDSDNDGLADWFEDRNGNGNWEQAYESQLTDVDSDWDGRSDWEEVMLDNTLSTTETSRGQGRQFWVRFDNDFKGEQGEMPTVFNNVNLVSNWNGNGASFKSSDSRLIYNILETNGTVNLPTTAKVGGVTIRCWFRPDWVPYPCTGTNANQVNYQSLTNKLRLFEMGCWRVSLSPEGTRFIFETRPSNANNVWITNINYTLPSFAPNGCGSINPNDAWEFLLVFDQSSSYLYVNGVSGDSAVGSGTYASPTDTERNQGFTIGNTYGGGLPAMGIIDEFEVFTGLQTSAYGQTLKTREEHLITRLTNNTVYLDWTQAYKSNVIKRKVVSTGVETTLANAVQDHRYTDTGLADSTLYQYEVGGRQAYVGRNLPVTVYRGRVLLLIDETLTSALANEIEIFRLDLLGDGWQVATNAMPRMNDNAWATTNINAQYITNVKVVKDFIRTNYLNYSNDLKGIILLGHVTVPYSGTAAEDGHNGLNDLQYHKGAWPADSYYGEMDGSWTDSLTHVVPANNSVAVARAPLLNNYPGDGKWDDSELPPNGNGTKNLELFVGRIDFALMPAWNASFPGSTNGEVDLLKRYLSKNHAYRLKQNSYNLDASFSAAPGHSFVANIGAAIQVSSRFFGSDALDSYQRASTELSASVTFASMGGNGAPERIIGWRGDHILSSIFRSREIPAPFLIWRGSEFVDWNLSQDNFLKASLTGPNHGLVAVWLQQLSQNLPILYWRFGKLGLAGTIGDALLETLDGRFIDVSCRTTYIIGDPTIRMLQIAPPSNLTHTTTGGSVTLSWSPSLEPVDNYLVFSSPNLNTPFTNLLATTTSTTYTTNSGGTGKWYQVRAAGLSSTSGTTVKNLSLGVNRHVQ